MVNIINIHWDLSIKDLENHYEESRKAYNELALEGGEMHIAYYRDKHPMYYSRLNTHYMWADEQQKIASDAWNEIELDWYFELEAESKKAFEIEEMKRDNNE